MRSPRRPDGRNQTAFAQVPEAFGPPVGVSAQGLQQNAFISFGDRPRASDNVYGKAARTYRPTRLTRLARMAGRWKGVLGAGTDCILKPCCRSQELCSVFAALGQRPPRANFFAPCREVTNKDS